jgi:aspartyl-tRNA synthetase
MMERTIYCGDVSERDVGRKITACGWVQTKRDMGGVIFVDLKDREGILQVVFNAQKIPENEYRIVETLRNQSVIAVFGEVFIRDEETYNPKLKTGTVELRATRLELLSEADPLPFSLDDDVKVREDLRLKYRFLDLRRPEMFENLRCRHRLLQAVRAYLDAEGFIEVETPILTKSTPEGARDYLVPSRVHQGTFYALPQSPQIFKQLLMVAGMDKYYQVARCFRDEDLRADRQPEFTQVDMEMSFVDREKVLNHLEKLFKHIIREMKGVDIAEPFARITWQQAMDLYGSDKPDLRFDMKIVDLSELAGRCGFSVFRSVIKSGGVVRALNIKGGAEMPRSEIEALTDRAVGYGAKGMAWIAIRPDGGFYSIMTKYFTDSELGEIVSLTDGKPGDFILFCADKLTTVRRVLGSLRLDIADSLGLRKKDDYKFLFVTDFPQFEYSEQEKRFVATHHPFTMPFPEDMRYLLSDPARVRAQAYDVVLNGVELGSGSIRIHDRKIQQKMFEALGFSEEETNRRFGFMLNAFRYGTPPHGGFAFGLDRLAMLLVGAESLREVIAFPKIKDASCPMTNAPDTVDREQLDVLGLTQAPQENAAAYPVKVKVKHPQIDAEHIARLAKLKLLPEKKQKLVEDMNAIIAFADKLSEINTDDIEPTAHVVPLVNVLRDDVPVSAPTREALLKNAPSKTDEYILVPRVVE